MDNYKRIDLSDRIAIQASIEKGYSLAETALRIKKSPSSVYREITNNSCCKSARKTCSHCAKTCVIKPKFILGECPEFVPSFVVNYLIFHMYVIPAKKRIFVEMKSVITIAKKLMKELKN